MVNLAEVHYRSISLSLVSNHLRNRCGPQIHRNPQALVNLCFDRIFLARVDQCLLLIQSIDETI